MVGVSLIRLDPTVWGVWMCIESVQIPDTHFSLKLAEMYPSEPPKVCSSASEDILMLSLVSFCVYISD